MKKTLLLMSLLPLVVFAQEKGRVGINEGNPKATLEISVSKENESTKTKEGILIPRVSRLRAANMGADVTESTLVYIDKLDGSATGTTAQVNEKGFYYFSNPNGAETQSVANGQWVRLGADAVAGTTLGTLPKYTTVERDKLKGVEEGSLIYNTTTKQVEVYNGTGWNTVSGVATTNPGGGVTPPGGGVQPPSAGSGQQGGGSGHATIAPSQQVYVPSLQYGNSEYQGYIDNTTHKITIKIPYTNGNNIAYEQVDYTVSTNADAGQDGDVNQLTLYIPSGRFNSGGGVITGEIIVSGTDQSFKVKKQTLTNGGTEMGKALIASIPIKLGDVYHTVNVEAISGIPDKKFGVETDGKLEHQFVYIPITGPDGRTWLNNNLGADYANVNSPHFNPTQQATSKTDYKAYGSLFQWGREADGSELVDWTSLTSGGVVHSNLSWSSDMSSSLTTYHDPCPNGYHTPSKSEWGQLLSKVGSGNSNMWKERQLNLPAAGSRHYTLGSQFRYTGSVGYYWSSSHDGSGNAWELHFNSSDSGMSDVSRSFGQPVRCLKD
ncbi:FISUMP domain-containing protein [Ornithobacterium rhinotracheale]|uniref:FISUMP domain-containing protein n=2 Tax=Ornithobacterium rhinotracheale TaxID=28251 RepID=UPI0040369546